MRFTVPFLLAIAVYVATVLGANQTSFNPNEDMLYDVVSASDAIAFRLERAIGLAEQPALLIGAFLLTIPALLTFHLFRMGFGGSVQSLIQEDRLSRDIAREREQARAARYATAAGASSYDGEVLTRSRAGNDAETVGGKNRRTGKDRRDGKERRRGLGANIAAAIKGRTGGKASSSSTTGSTSGTTTLGSSAQEGAPASSSGGGLKDRWANILEKKPDLSRLKAGAQGWRKPAVSTETVSSKSGKLSLDDLADDATDRS